MSRKPSKVPSYCRHKHSGQAVVRIGGRDHYLGDYGSQTSYARYEELVAHWRAQRLQADVTASIPLATDVTVNHVLLAYVKFAAAYYVRDGQATKELACMRDALRPVRQLFGHALVRDFGPKSLKAIRQHLIDKGLARSHINHRISRIKRVFKWAVAEELIPPAIFHGLLAVTGLQFGRTEARETEPIRPVPDEVVDAVLPFLTPTVAAMVRLQRLTGMRPGEVVIMRACDIDMTEAVWLFEPHDHKTKWRGHRKLVPLGPLAQKILRPFLARDPETYLFSPRESDQWRRERRASQANPNRRTPIYPSELRARERAKAARRNRMPTRTKHDRYNTASYYKAIIYAVAKATKDGISAEHWHPNQLRHARGTEVRRKYGIEAAQVILGHARADVTQLYAEKNFALAKTIASETG